MSVDAEYLATVTRQKQVCYQCVKEPFLSAHIKDSGRRASCSYCRRVRESVRIHEIADTFEAAFQRHYYRTPAEMSDYDYEMERGTGEPWERDGEPILALLQDTACITAEIAEDIRRELNDGQESHENQESEFDRGSYYAEKPIGLGAFRDEWTAFEERLQSQSRYFSRAASTTLAMIFQGLRELQTHEGSRVIREAGPGTNLEALYRARIFQADHKLREALKRPDLEVGSPSAASARAGRMNSHGISVFYGATNPSVAMAEVRPPVGSRVMTARFELVRRLQLLDLDALRSLNVEGSIFDPTHLERSQKAKFLAVLSRRITAPVMPDDELLAYLPTQVVADFLANEVDPRLDGIIYRSVQAGKGGINVVLFHKAALVEQLHFPPGTEIETQLYARPLYAGDEGVDYAAIEVIPSDSSKREMSRRRRFESRNIARSERREPALRVDLDSVEVHHIKAVSFVSEAHAVYRIKTDDAHMLFRVPRAI